MIKQITILLLLLFAELLSAQSNIELVKKLDVKYMTFDANPVMDQNSIGLLSPKYQGAGEDRNTIPTSFIYNGKVNIVDYLSKRIITFDKSFNVESVKLVDDSNTFFCHYNLIYTRSEDFSRWIDNSGSTFYISISSLHEAQKYYESYQYKIPIFICFDDQFYFGDSSVLYGYKVAGSDTKVIEKNVIENSLENAGALKRLGFSKTTNGLFFSGYPASILFDQSWETFLKINGIPLTQEQMKQRQGTYFIGFQNSIVVFNNYNVNISSYNIKTKTVTESPFELPGGYHFLGIAIDGSLLYHKVLDEKGIKVFGIYKKK